MTTRDADGVVSGIDAVAAPVKPDHVAVGQRWEVDGHRFTVICKSPNGRCFPDGVSIGELARLANPRVTRYRLKPEPLPVPGPRVSRVAKMVREEAGFFEGNGNTFPLVSVEQAEAIAKRVVGATLDVVRDEVRPLLGSGVDPALDRARAAMLEPKPACPGRRP